MVVEYERPPWKGVPAVSGGPCPRCGREQRITVVFENRTGQRREDEP